MAGATSNAGAASGQAPVPLPPLEGSLALVDVPLLDGGTFRAASADGKVLVLYWWASWCPFCAMQTPQMQALWEVHRDRGLLLLGISIDKRADDARRYLARHGYTFPSTFDTPEVRRAFPLPGKGLPVTVVRGRSARVVMSEAGQLFPEDVERIARFL
jgi:peroxiredoxin